MKYEINLILIIKSSKNAYKVSVQHSYVNMIFLLLIACATGQSRLVRLWMLQIGFVPYEWHPQVLLFEVITDTLGYSRWSYEANPAAFLLLFKSTYHIPCNLLKFVALLECLYEDELREFNLLLCKVLVCINSDLPFIKLHWQLEWLQWSHII